jgi:hypothetical protein
MAPVKSVVMLLTGGVMALAGALFRSCASSLPPEFANAWCGSHKPAALVAAAHQHCAGCVMLAAGLVLMAAAMPFASLRLRRSAATWRRS